LVAFAEAAREGLRGVYAVYLAEKLLGFKRLLIFAESVNQNLGAFEEAGVKESAVVDVGASLHVAFDSFEMSL
jgi:hypothetical protein